MFPSKIPDFELYVCLELAEKIVYLVIVYELSVTIFCYFALLMCFVNL